MGCGGYLRMHSSSTSALICWCPAWWEGTRRVLLPEHRPDANAYELRRCQICSWRPVPFLFSPPLPLFCTPTANRVPCLPQTITTWPITHTSALMESLPLKSWPTDKERSFWQCAQGHEADGPSVQGDETKPRAEVTGCGWVCPFVSCMLSLCGKEAIIEGPG